MLTLNLRDFSLSSYSVSEITVVGHYVYIDDTCDEENFDHFINLKNIDAATDVLESLGLYEFVGGLCAETLADMVNWGVSEQDYESLAVSDKWQLRKMVALNGRMLAQLSKDKDVDVRRATLENLAERQAIGVSLGDTDWLNAMIDDEDRDVRRYLALLGNPKHLDILIHDKNELVAAQAVIRASEQQMDTLSDNISEYIKLAIAKNPLASQSQLKMVAVGADNRISYALAKRGFVANP